MSAVQQSMDHRWGTRTRVDIATALRSALGRPAMARVRDASITGAFLETEEELPVLSRVSIRPFTSTGKWLHACIVRKEETGVAIEWLDPGVDPLGTLFSARRQSGPDGGATRLRGVARLDDFRMFPSMAERKN